MVNLYIAQNGRLVEFLRPNRRVVPTLEPYAHLFSSDIQKMNRWEGEATKRPTPPPPQRLGPPDFRKDVAARRHRVCSVCSPPTRRRRDAKAKVDGRLRREVPTRGTKRPESAAALVAPSSARVFATPTCGRRSHPSCKPLSARLDASSLRSRCKISNRSMVAPKATRRRPRRIWFPTAS